MTNIFLLALHETTEEIKECWEIEERWGYLFVVFSNS